MREAHPRLFAPVGSAQLAWFRIVFGLVMVWEMVRFCINGWIVRYYVDPPFHFKYFGCEWVRAWPADGMYLHFALLAGLAACLVMGVCYRAAAALFFVGFTYVFLLDQTHYVNHFYLASLVSLLLAFLPLDRALSVDAARLPHFRSRTAPTWALWLLRMQIGIPYVYGGLAKLDADWLGGGPLRLVLSEEWMVTGLTYGWLLFELLVVPALLWRRTRAAALCAAVAFHVLDASLFGTGTFPWFMLAATFVLFPPRWLERLMQWSAWRSWAAPEHAAAPPDSWRRSWVLVLTFYVAFQVVFPFRHVIYGGNPNWTGEGHRFAWRTEPRALKADARFFATDPDLGETWEIDPTTELTHQQFTRMAASPDMILQYAHHVADRLRREGHERVEVRARVVASLNGRRPQLLVNPDTDLAAEPRTLGPALWILPLAPR